MNLPEIKTTRKTGDEVFCYGDKELTFNLIDFWQWANSDLVSNTARGILAEYIVAKALGLGKDDVRIEWNPYDLVTDTGIRIEVKSSAYIQSWDQEGYSKIQFSIKKTRTWDPKTNQIDNKPTRSSDVYVFALLVHKDQGTINPMDLSQWEFYVIPTKILNELKKKQNSITLSSLINLSGRPIKYFQL